jgi:hypothetical protein
LSNIGEDLLVVSSDQPFRFPAEFTFVVRAFSVLDGRGLHSSTFQLNLSRA